MFLGSNADLILFMSPREPFFFQPDSMLPGKGAAEQKREASKRPKRMLS